jgi:hypothetical protein
MYNLVIRGSLYDPFNDTYNYLTVDGVDYNSGGSLLNENNGGFTFFIVGGDYASAIPDQIGNGYNYFGGAIDGTADAYYFMFVTTEPHSISVNVTLSGVTSSIPVTGGVISIGNRCVTINTANPNLDTIAVWTLSLPNELSVNSDYFRSQGVIMSDVVNLNLYLNNFFNTTNSVLPISVTYKNNGNGTITLNYTYPLSPITLKSVTDSLIVTTNFINC